MMKMQRVMIDLKPISWIANKRKSYRDYKKVSSEWKIATTIALVRQKPLPFPKEAFPLMVAVIAHWKGKKKYNIDSLFVRPVFETFTDFGLIPDDNVEYLGRVTFYGKLQEPKDFLEIIMLSNDA